MSDTISLTRDEVAILLRAPNFDAYEKVSKRLVAFDRSEPAPADKMQGDGEAAIIECLAAGKPFVFDPATNFLHADDGTVEYGIRYVPDDSQPAPADQMVGTELPADIVKSLLAVGPVEWGQTFCQSDEKHVEDFAHSLQMTRESFGIDAQETTIHYVCLEGTATILALAGNSPNAPQSARILAGAWNHLVGIAKAQAAATPETKP